MIKEYGIMSMSQWNFVMRIRILIEAYQQSYGLEMKLIRDIIQLRQSGNGLVAYRVKDFGFVYVRFTL